MGKQGIFAGFLDAAAHVLGAYETRCRVCGDMALRSPAGPLPIPEFSLFPSPPLCRSCAWALRPRTKGYCLQCGAVYDNIELEPNICAECSATPKPWQRFLFHGVYEGVLRELIVQYKFEGRLGLSSVLRGLALSVLLRNYNSSGPANSMPQIIVPIPLHTKRLRERGFNQSLELIIQGARFFSRPIVNSALHRQRFTRPQTGLSKRERRENIRNAFRVDPEAVKGKSILLVDDVSTTGSTLVETGKTLRKAGVESIDVLVLARAQQ